MKEIEEYRDELGCRWRRELYRAADGELHRSPWELVSADPKPSPVGPVLFIVFCALLALGIVALVAAFGGSRP